MRTPALCLILATASLARASAGVIIVDPAGGEHTTIQSGIDAAAPGDLVLVLPGTYRGPANRDLTFGAKNITLQSFVGAEETIVDCQGLGRAISLGAGVDSTSVIEGFTFMNGVAPGSGGGAARFLGASPLVRSCVFLDNTATHGGAIWISPGPAPRLSYCTFANNAAQEGGAVAASEADPVVEWCTFYRNAADRGGGLWLDGGSAAIAGCTFASNWAGESGGAMSLGASSASVERSIMAFSGSGGAVGGGENSEIFHSCIYGNVDGDSLSAPHHDNRFEDPRFCDLADDSHTLCSNSCCLPSNNTWHLHVGSRAQGCGDCVTAVHASSWGVIKGLFRK